MLLKEVKLDSEFQKRLRPQSREEAESMRDSIDKLGYLMPLIVWAGKGILIDGHHRFLDWQRRQAEYEAAKPKGLGSMLRAQPKAPPTPDFIQMEFADRAAVLRFIDELQYAKRNLNEVEMGVIRARFMNVAKATMPESEAAAKTAEHFGISERTARRDAVLGEDVDKLEPLVSEQLSQSMAQVLASDNPPSRSIIHEAAQMADQNPKAAVALLERDATDKRCKPRVDGSESPKPPSWEKHVITLTKALAALHGAIDELSDEDRIALRPRLKAFGSEFNAVFAATKSVKQSA